MEGEDKENQLTDNTDIQYDWWSQTYLIILMGLNHLYVVQLLRKNTIEPHTHLYKIFWQFSYM